MSLKNIKNRADQFCSPFSGAHILTFDIEEWYHSNLSSINGQIPPGALESRVERATYRLLELLAQTGNSATFFVLGDVAEKHPGLIRDIDRAGHEVGTHGHSHRLIYEMTPADFAKETERSVKYLQDLLGKQIHGYRAASWSVPENLESYFSVLYQNGITYDSSLYPFRTYLYGSNEYPIYPYIVEYEEIKLLEWPPSVYGLYKKFRIPFSGGFFLRILPLNVIEALIRLFSKRYACPVVLYLHPWEIDDGIPRLKLPWNDRFIQYSRIDRCEAKLVTLLKKFRFLPFREFVLNDDDGKPKYS
jgi:polysaccharide deacetylase family protein (PEP-CTERM system associated)